MSLIASLHFPQSVTFHSRHDALQEWATYNPGKQMLDPTGKHRNWVKVQCRREDYNLGHMQMSIEANERTSVTKTIDTETHMAGRSEKSPRFPLRITDDCCLLSEFPILLKPAAAMTH